MKKERNYTIEFFRFMFAINFILIHALMIFPLGYMGFTMSAAKDAYIFRSDFDVILPFMIFSGYFMMQGFRKAKAENLEPVPAHKQALGYLSTRLKSLFPLMLIGLLAGWVANGIWRGYSLAQYPAYFLASIGEFLGLQLSGIGMGNGFVGNWYSTTAAVRLLSNTPIWFISGIFICGYVIYYLLAKDEHKVLALILPAVTILFMGSCWINDTIPLWNAMLDLGGFTINTDLVLMFIGLGLGCELWVAVDALKEKTWSTGGKVALTIGSVLSFAVVLIRSWVSGNSAFVQNYFNIGWGATMIFSVFFCFFVLLDVDWLSRCPIWHNKIWKVPGQLSLYIYVIHFPVLIFTALAMGLKDSAARSMANGVSVELPTGPVTLGIITEGDAKKLIITFVLTIVFSIVIGYLLMLLNTKVIQPWINRKPWFVEKKEQVAVNG
jgi:hypothetical protein